MQAGTLMAAADRFWVRVVGRGGHGAMPHMAIDPVVAAAAAVGALQPLVSRETSPTTAAVVTVAEFNTGAALTQTLIYKPRFSYGLQPLVARETSPTTAAVVTVAEFNTGASLIPTP